MGLVPPTSNISPWTCHHGIPHHSCPAFALLPLPEWDSGFCVPADTGLLKLPGPVTTGQLGVSCALSSGHLPHLDLVACGRKGTPSPLEAS